MNAVSFYCQMNFFFIILSLLCRIIMMILDERHPKKYEKINALSCSQIINEWANCLLPARQTYSYILVAKYQNKNKICWLRTFMIYFQHRLGRFSIADCCYIHHLHKPASQVVKCCANKWLIFHTQKQPKS